MASKPKPPSIDMSFSCPHCKALAHQSWYRTHPSPYDKDRLPLVRVDEKKISELLEDDIYDVEKKEQKELLAKYYFNINEGHPFLSEDTMNFHGKILYNVNLTKCFSCNQFAVWINDRLVYPTSDYEVFPNEDLPSDIKIDFIEAGRILPFSPRGSAALLRLCIQKLCISLGEKGKNINADIASLVAKGLDQRIQQALDIVRVIGNEAVHPGQIDLKDDRATAERLFELVNMIADRMISEQKRLDEMYSRLPEAQLKQIAERDKKSGA